MANNSETINANSCIISNPIDVGNWNTNDLAAISKMFSCASKLNLLFALDDEERCVCDLTDGLGIEQSLLSHHLRDFRELEIVSATKKGRFMHYSLTEYGKKLADYYKNFPLKGGDTK